MTSYKFCTKCGNKLLSDGDNSLCSTCMSNHRFAVFLKNFINYLDGRLIFDDNDFIGMGIDKFDINGYIWKLNELNLILFHDGNFFIKLDESNNIIDLYYIEGLDEDFKESTKLEVYDPKKFILNKESRNYKSDILYILKKIKFVDENPKVPFPQSDDLNRFIFIGQHLFKKDLTKDEIKQSNQIGDRIVNMYTSTGFYFNVFEKYKKNNEIFYKLSKKGEYIFSLEEYDRNLNICKCILEHEILYNIFMDCFSNGVVSKDNIVNIMLQYDLNLNSMVTIKRRAGCISSWMHWIFRLMFIDI